MANDSLCAEQNRVDELKSRANIAEESLKNSNQAITNLQTQIDALRQASLEASRESESAQQALYESGNAAKLLQTRYNEALARIRDLEEAVKQRGIIQQELQYVNLSCFTIFLWSSQSFIIILPSLQARERCSCSSDAKICFTSNPC